MHVDIGIKPNDSSEICDPECKPGQCCRDGKCYCIDTMSMTMSLCPGINNYVQLTYNYYVYNYIYSVSLTVPHPRLVLHWY